jgi:hypothetical protein
MGASAVTDGVTSAAGLDLSHGFEEGIRDHHCLQTGGCGQPQRCDQEKNPTEARNSGKAQDRANLLPVLTR